MIIGDLHLSMGDFKPNHCPSVNVLHTSILTTKLQYGDNLLKNRLQRFRGCAREEWEGNSDLGGAQFGEMSYPGS